MIRLLSGSIPKRNIGRNLSRSSRLFDFNEETTNRAISHYRYSKYTVKGNHPLVNLILGVNVPLSLDIQRYIDNVQVAALQVSKSLGMGSVIAEPELFNKGWFYGIPEVIYCIADDYQENVSWFNLHPVKVVKHPRTDVTYTLLDGMPNTEETGFSVIQINLVELMIMYRGWQLWQNAFYPDAPAGPVEFVGSWILPSMIESHNSVALVNKLKNSLLGLPFAETLKRVYFSLPKNGYLETNYRNYVIETIEKNNLPWEDLLQLVMVDKNTTLLQFAQSPDVVNTRYGKGINLLSTINTIEFLLVAESESNKNSTERNELIIMLNRYSNEKWFGYSKLAHLVNKQLNDTIIALL